MLSQLQDTRNLPGSQLSTHLEMRRNLPNGPHMAVPSILKQTAHGPHLQTCSGLEQCQGSTIDGKCSNANEETNKTVSKRTVHKMPFQIHEKGNLLVPKPSTHVKTCKTITYGPQMAILPTQQQPNDGPTSQDVGKLKLRHTDAVDREHSKVNVKTMENVSGDRMMRNTPSMIQERNIPLNQQPMHSKTCNRSLHSPQ